MIDCLGRTSALRALFFFLSLVDPLKVIFRDKNLFSRYFKEDVIFKHHLFFHENERQVLPGGQAVERLDAFWVFIGGFDACMMS